MAVVKADGYGHGSTQAARAAVAGGADWLGVVHVAEALKLRRAGLTVPVLVLMALAEDAQEDAIRAGIDLTAARSRWSTRSPPPPRRAAPRPPAPQGRHRPEPRRRHPG